MILRRPDRPTFLMIQGLIAFALMALILLPGRTGSTRKSTPGDQAALLMEESVRAIQDHCRKHHLKAEHSEDPGQTGLIGPEWSAITTSIGDPEAKRTTLNPQFAALIAHLLTEAGLQKGDTIAIGSSGSFPAPLIASLAAARSLGLHPMVIISLGSSSFGASNPSFNLLDIYRLLANQGLVKGWPVAASFGGEDDTGTEFDPIIRDQYRAALEHAGIPLIEPADLAGNIRERERHYFGENPSRIRVFINSGGGYANLGSSPLALKIRPGLIRRAPMPEPGQQGMIHAMLNRGIPVIHLLYIKGLCQKYQLPWDPVSGSTLTGKPADFSGRPRTGTFIISLMGLIWFAAVLIRFRMLYSSAK